MILSKLFEKNANTGLNMRINRSRCSRMRFNQNSCDTCMEYCFADAITVEGELCIDPDACSECMLCVSVCPSEALQINMLDFYSIIARLRKVQSPVLACSVKPDLCAHVKIFCLGFLSEEHIIALSAFLKKPLQINLTKCKDCQNGSIVNILKERFRIVSAKTSIKIHEKIKLVENRTDLNYKEVSLDRRSFFKALKKKSTQEVIELFDKANPGEMDHAYSNKVLPVKRDLLNKALLALSGEIKKKIVTKYFYDVKVDNGCNLCNACVKICPTGALSSRKEIGELHFSSASCNGCRLCEDFCKRGSIQVVSGFEGEDPSKKYLALKGS